MNNKDYQPSCLMFLSRWYCGVSMIFTQRGWISIWPWILSLNTCQMIHQISDISNTINSMTFFSEASINYLVEETNRGWLTLKQVNLCMGEMKLLASYIFFWENQWDTRRDISHSALLIMFIHISPRNPVL